MAPAFLSRFRPLLSGAMLVMALAMAGCVSMSSVDSLAGVTPSGSDFSQALFRDYSYLAHSFNISGSGSSTAFDAEGAMSMGGPSSDVTDLANAFADKALRASTGEPVLPENPVDNDADSTAMYQRLLQALDQGRDKAPALAARAQADYDCWILDTPISAMAAAAAQCRSSLGKSLPQLESTLNLAPPQAEAATTATTTTATAGPSADYTVYFDLNSWTLTADDMTVLTQIIGAARQGQQSTINIVGHTDTSGSEAHNKGLSLRRANVVKDALVQMGAREKAIQVSGAGETDLAVQTANGVPEAKNRRTVITLVP